MATSKAKPRYSRVGFIGGGHIAKSLMGGMIQNGFKRSDIFVSDISSSAREQVKQMFDVQIEESNLAVAKKCETVILAVKPQDMRELVQDIDKQLKKTQPLLISVAAGVRLDDLDDWSGNRFSIVRVMPNTPVFIQKGVCALYANPRTTRQEKISVAAIFRTVGKNVWLKSEQLMDAVTAVSGSGPAYVYYLIEAMEQAAIEQGLNEDVARTLVTQTAVGATLMATGSEASPHALRKQVTSPGGTTEAAMQLLEQSNVKDKIIEAVAAAQKRAVELSKPSTEH